jgi:hypothetical protein
MLHGFRHRFLFPNFLIAGLALVSQLVLGTLVLPEDTPSGRLAALKAVSLICVGKAAPSRDRPPRHTHRAADPAICPLSVALALPGVVLAPAPVPPAPSRALLPNRTWTGPPSRGPPPLTARVGLPRAPPLTA